jgi:cyclase
MGAGEILITSVDREGTKKGFDVELTKCVTDAVRIPVIVSGGAGTPEHLKEVFDGGNPDAAAIASICHYKLFSISEMKHFLSSNKILVRL